MDLYDEALARFDEVYDRAVATGVREPNAMNVATVGTDGRPSSRIVLLKGHDRRGFVFYTNTRSRKGEELAASAHAALCFFWNALHEQVRIEGSVEPVSEEEADAYFASRARESQIGAWASEQSMPLRSRDTLEARIEAVQRQYPDEVPRPPHWSGYRVVPERIEFWRGVDFRLHERTLYRREPEGWQKGLLNP